MAHDVFLSYRRSDQELARALVEAMTAQGLDVWWDQRIEGGEDWRDAIVEGLTASSALIILFSDECNDSKQLKKELAIADTLDKEVIPILIEDTKPKGHYLYELAARNWLQIHPNPETKVADVAGRLARELRTGPGRNIAAAPSAPVAESMATAPSAEETPRAYQEPSLQADTVEKVVGATRAKEKSTRERRDFLPFKWYEILIALVFGGLGVLGGFDMETGEVITGSLTLDAIMIFLMTLLVIAMFVFPFRYYFRRRRVWRAVRAYAMSIGVLAIATGVLIGIHPDIQDQTVGLGENLLYGLVGSIIVFGFIAIITFGIYGLLHFQRTMRSFNNNVEAI
ncbi:MAG: toll/interleukin-1 receptor domain-containing protein [Pseudomonadota bacterium]